MNHRIGLSSRAMALSAEIVAARSFTSELISHWPSDQVLRAGTVLEQHPELQSCKSVLIDLAYEEYCQRLEVGEEIEPEAFVDRFPSIRSSLLELIQVHEFLDEDSRLAGAHAEPCWPKPGDSFLGFQLLEELGRGAFSRVFFAAELSLGNRLVVVKVTTMGRHEAHTLGQLDHPHIVPIFSVQSDDGLGLTAVCMPYLGRTTLFDVIDGAFAKGKAPRFAGAIVEAARRENRGSSPASIPGVPHGWCRSWSYVEGALYLGSQVAEALAFTHGRGFLHCDIKPSNVLVTETGQALLFDFNLSFLGAEDVPTAGGTIPYMAPEQLDRVATGVAGQQTPLNSRTDIFGLAVTMYELLTGRLPFGSVPMHLTRTQTAAHFLKKQRQGPAPLLDLNPHVDRRIAGVIESCLSFLPDERFQSAAELSQVFRSELTWRRHAVRWLSENRRRVASAMMATSVVTGGVVHELAQRDPYPLRELRAGWVAHQQGDFSTALAHLDRALAADQQLNDARFLRGLTRMDQGDWDVAWSDFKALENQIEDPRVLACLGHLTSIKLRDYSAAASYYNLAIKQGYKPAVLLNNLGYCYDKDGDLKLAERYLRQAVAADPSLQVAFHNLARVNLRLTVEAKRPPDTTIVERALDLGTETVELNICAAQVFAAAAKFEPRETRRQKLLERSLVYCEKARQFGATRSQLLVTATYYPFLLAEQHFQDVLTQAKELNSPPPPALAYLVNPVGRIDILPSRSVASR